MHDMRKERSGNFIWQARRRVWGEWDAALRWSLNYFLPSSPATDYVINNHPFNWASSFFRSSLSVLPSLVICTRMTFFSFLLFSLHNDTSHYSLPSSSSASWEERRIMMMMTITIFFFFPSLCLSPYFAVVLSMLSCSWRNCLLPSSSPSLMTMIRMKARRSCCCCLPLSPQTRYHHPFFSHFTFFSLLLCVLDSLPAGICHSVLVNSWKTKTKC